jgi:hypothetical protein
MLDGRALFLLARSMTALEALSSRDAFFCRLIRFHFSNLSSSFSIFQPLNEQNTVEL